MLDRSIEEHIIAKEDDTKQNLEASKNVKDTPDNATQSSSEDGDADKMDEEAEAYNGGTENGSHHMGQEKEDGLSNADAEMTDAEDKTIKTLDDTNGEQKLVESAPGSGSPR